MSCHKAEKCLSFLSCVDNKGFTKIVLDEISFLTTMQTALVQYLRLRMPFGVRLGECQRR